MVEKIKDKEQLPKAPQAFWERMEKMLGGEYPAFLKSYEDPRTYGLRVNTSKISCQEFEKLAPFALKKIPWISNGYYYNEETQPSKCPYYAAGLYYLQEPSAMTPGEVLPVEEGDLLLDLCAAPGGKATAAGAKLNGRGLLAANDISASRAKALLRNVELFGISNAFVTSEKPQRLAEAFPEFFNKIILDAPCSGEGMFRKEEALARDWSPEKSQMLSEIQKELCAQAISMLSPGGLLLYSTCTFAPAEDEMIISYVLEQFPSMELLPLPAWEGFCQGRPDLADGNEELRKCLRIFPHKMRAEGHFMALLHKKGPVPDPSSFPSLPRRKTDKKNMGAMELVHAFFEEIALVSIGGRPIDENRIEIRADKVYYLPPVPGNFEGLHFIRNGVYLGDLKKNRFEPSQPFALALHKGDAGEALSLPVSDERLLKYLRGESIEIREGEAGSPAKGWKLLCVDGYPLGFGKLVNGILKNKYPSGWRN